MLDSTIIAAIIGALAMVSVGFGPKMVEVYRQRGRYRRPEPARRKALQNEWEGPGEDRFVERKEFGKVKFRMHLEFRVRANGRIVGGGHLSEPSAVDDQGNPIALPPGALDVQEIEFRQERWERWER